MGLRSVTKLWAHTHFQDPRADQHSKRTLTVFPFPHFLHSPFSTLLMVPQGGRESLLFIHLFLGGEKRRLSQQETNRGRRWCWAETLSWTFTLLANMAAGRPNTPQTLWSLHFPPFILQQTDVTFLRLLSEFKPLNPVNHAQKGTQAAQTRFFI